MNKKQIIATLVGALVLFIWQFLSWAAIPIHKEVYGYTANQEMIMNVLTQSNLDEGTYMLPTVPPGTSHDVAQQEATKNIGKPWASVTYHKSFDMSMGMNMFRGFVVDLLSVFLIVWLLGRMGINNRQTARLFCMIIGFIGYLTIPYLNSIWFGGNTLAHLADAIIPWAIVGSWLGWYLNK